MEIVPSYGPEQVLAMDALLALALCEAKVDQMERVQPSATRGPRDGEWTDNADGSRTMRIGSMDTLRTFLQRGIS